MSADRDELEAERGLEARYHVTKINDPDGKHTDCRYFVLDPQHDPLARSALLGYAGACMEEGRDQLARDLIEWVGECEARERHASLMADLDDLKGEG